MSDVKRQSELNRVFMANVKGRRKELGITQAQVCEAIGMHQSNYSTLEAGARIVGLDVVELLCELLAIDAAELLQPHESSRT